MMIYIDSDYKCHAENADGRRAFDVPIFDGKCAEFIDGYRYVPDGETWTRDDGTAFVGEMVSPCKPFAAIDSAQREYERNIAEAYEAALTELGVLPLEGVTQND